MAEVKGHTPANITRPTFRHKSKQHNPVLKSDDKYGKTASIRNKVHQKKDWHQTRPPDTTNPRCKEIMKSQKKTNTLRPEGKYDLRDSNIGLPPLNNYNSGLRPIFTQNWMYHKENPGPRAF